MENLEVDLPKKTPKQLTNAKQLSERSDDSYDKDDINDETPKVDDIIQDYYGEIDGDTTDRKDDEQLDMDYSQTQLEDFLKS